MKDQEFSIMLYDLGILKQILLLAGIKHINKSENNSSQVSHCQKREL